MQEHFKNHFQQALDISSALYSFFILFHPINRLGTLFFEENSFSQLSSSTPIFTKCEGCQMSIDALFLSLDKATLTDFSDEHVLQILHCAPFSHMCIFHAKLQLLKLFPCPSKLIFQSWSVVFSPLGYALIEAFFSPYFMMSSIHCFHFPHLCTVTLPVLPPPKKKRWSY